MKTNNARRNLRGSSGAAILKFLIKKENLSQTVNFTVINVPCISMTNYLQKKFMAANNFLAFMD